jgi:serine/threonine protein kinase
LGEKPEGPAENLLTKEKINRKDFDILKVIGRGSFGKVYLVKKRGTNNVYALKTLNKEVIAKRNLLVKTQGKYNRARDFNRSGEKNSRDYRKPVHCQTSLRFPD